MQRQLHRHLLLPAYETLLHRRRTFQYWKNLDRSQWFTAEQLEEMQLESLRKLVQHAFERCPYYRENWAERGLNPRQLQSLSDFSRWPLIDRDVIRANRMKMRAANPAMALITKATGGSSGTPLQFDLNTDSAQRREAAWHRGYSWGGAEPGRKLVFLWSVSLGKRPWWSEVKDDLYHRLYRRSWLNTFDVGEHTTLQYLRRINRCRPEAIVAYTHSLFAFVRSLKERGLKPYSPRSIVVGAEKLYPFQRALIEEVFQAPVFETYGSREFMLIGAECDRHEGLHLTQENLLVEVLDDDGNPTPPGQEGNVTITDLYNYGMPFIRYTNGDRAIAGWSKCSCGRGLPLLKEVTGRRSEMIHTADDRHLSGVFFPHLMKEFAAVRRFLVVQDAPNHLGVHLVLGPQWTEDDGVLLRREIQKAVGPAMNVDLIPVEEIPLTSAGKHRVVLNLCSTSGDEPARHGLVKGHAAYSSEAKVSVISN